MTAINFLPVIVSNLLSKNEKWAKKSPVFRLSFRIGFGQAESGRYRK